MIRVNIVYVMVEAANTFLLDADRELEKLGQTFCRKDKQDFQQLRKNVTSAKYLSGKMAESLYECEESKDALHDADWLYNFMKLIYDRIGEDKRKSHMLLEFLDTMPSEGVFKIGIESFHRL